MNSLAIKRALGFSVLVLVVYGLIIMPETTQISLQDIHTSQHSDVTAQRNSTPSDTNRHHETLSDVARSGLDYVRINNASLGFGEIFVLSLPERTDKRDFLAVQASVSNFSIKFLDGVDGDTISDNAIPYQFKQGRGQKGCWKAHLNAARKMDTENIQTAFILEDDADWDVSLHAQLREVARGVRWLGGKDKTGVYPHSPYGDD